jgi:hypothetical protein
MTTPILRKDRSYTFSDYFDLPNPTEDIVAELGYGFEFAKLTLPRADLPHPLDQLRTMFYRKLPHISLTSETAKREVMIAPVLLELLDYLEVKIDIEYPVYVNEQLKGNLDYLIRSQQEFIVVEAKKADMERGFTQLAVELIALDQRNDKASDLLFGAITVGDLWRFGVLSRAQKRISKDIDSFRVPSDLEELFKVLLGILNPQPVQG